MWDQDKMNKRMCTMASNKETVEEKKAQLIQLAIDFSQQYLNEEYNAVIEKLISKMARKRDTPFVIDICQFFGTKQSTTTQKSKKIRDMFNMTYFDGNFSTGTVDQSNPFNNLTMVDGLLIPKGMLQEEVDLDEWESKAAQILGVAELEKS